LSLSLFIFLIITLYVKNKFKKELLEYLHTHKSLRFIKEKYLTYLLLFFLALVLFIGIANPGTAKEKFKEISVAYNKMVNPGEKQRPNPMFDINTYPETKVW
jgi:L-asparagine transporter-like permease